MKIASFVTNLPTMDDTRTREDYYKYLGEKPTLLGVLGRLYPNNTAAFLTESLKNIFYLDKNKGNKYQSVNSFMYEWELEVNYIKRVEFAAVPVGDGAGGTEITMAFRERYYGKFDTFKIEKTGQHCFCVSNPIRKADNYWEQVVRLVSTDYDTVLNVEGCQPGDTTRWISNYHPELHDEGHVKWQSNVERHRGYLCTHRNDASYSAQYAAMEDVFIKIAEDKDGRHSEALYKMDRLEKNLLENFMAARNLALLLGKSNIDKNGKPTIVNPEDNRPIYITDGIIAQAEAFCSKHAYNKFGIQTLHIALSMLNEKADDPTGNHYIFLCNEKFWQDVNNVLGTYLAQYHTDGTYLWSMKANDYVSVGAKGFDTYRYAGNEITFKVDRALTLEYGSEKGFALCLDVTGNKTESRPPMAMFSLKGADIVTNKYIGVGGENGISSGVVSSPVAGGKRIVWGYSSVALFNPYKAAELREI